jgi:hypothetical protein
MEAKTINKYGSVSTNKLVKKAEKFVNEYVRLRDSDDNGYFRCISCGGIKPRHECDAGHYFSKTISIVRFDDRNLNAECHSCNFHDPNHLIGYKKNLIEKIGIYDFEVLENKAAGRDNFKWDRSELIDIIEAYSQKAKQLKKSKNY